MIKRQGKVRTIYNNYDLWEDCSEDARRYLIDCGIENPTDEEIWEEINFTDSCNWDDVKKTLINFFTGSDWILTGTLGTWRGEYKGGYIFDNFMDMFRKATKDCDYIHLFDVNGHFYLNCSHHDGSNSFEIKRITAKGMEYLERWENSYVDKRGREQVYEMVFKKYSVLPHYLHEVYECPKIEYEKATA